MRQRRRSEIAPIPEITPKTFPTFPDDRRRRPKTFRSFPIFPNHRKVTVETPAIPAIPELSLFQPRNHEAADVPGAVL